MNENKTKRLMVMAGGTGGHIFPALAVAKSLMAQGWQIRWLGTEDRMEATLVPANNIEIDFIQVKGLLGSGFKRKLLAPWMIVKATLQARKAIKAYQPDVVLGMGGYVSGPGGLAAFLSGVPIVLHEQNAVAGFTNSLLAKIATSVMQAFPSAFADAKVVGNPVRQDILALPAHKPYQSKAPLSILIMGGSQGAAILNERLPQAFAKLNRAVHIRHQAGKGNQATTLQAYEKYGVTATVSEFIDDVASAYADADLVICRSGALTVSEIAVAGVAALFVPFMHKDRQQALNAEFLVLQQAALMIEQPELSVEKLKDTIDDLSAEKINAMAQNARALAIVDATEQVAQVIATVSK